MKDHRAHSLFENWEQRFRAHLSVPGPIRLVLSPHDCYDATLGRGCEPRSFAWCKPCESSIYLARRALSLPQENVEALLLHELGHLCDPYWCRAGSEARADQIAEHLSGRKISYDRNDVQTLARGRRPRPAHLAR